MQKPKKDFIKKQLEERFKKACETLNVETLKPYDAALIAINHLEVMEEVNIIKIIVKKQ